MAINEKAKFVLDKYSALKNQRSTWESHWQDVANYFLPRKSNITLKRTRGDKRHDQIYDGTATHALELLSASLNGMLTNAISPWFVLKYRSEMMNQDDEAKEWLESCAKIMSQVFQRSNFQQEIFELYHELLTFGTSAMFITDDEQDDLRFKTIHISEIYITENEKGMVDCLVRRFHLRNRNILATYPDAVLPQNILNQIRSDQGGTVTGRFSMSNPNLQQIPARHPELGPLIRSIFIPESDRKWGTFDYSQQESRILVHYAKLQELPGVNEIVDAYRAGDADFHQVVADMAGIERKQAKTINLGLMYGMGKNKLMAELGLMKESAEKLIKQYHVKAPFVKRLMENVSNKANDRGKIRTLLGRACHFDLWQPIHFGVYKPLPLEQARKEYDEPLKRAFTYKALNRLIQGSAADMTKKSMVCLYENGIIPHIQIHDEVDISVESDKKAEEIIKIMESAVELQVPNKVDFDSGDNWGEIK